MSPTPEGTTRWYAALLPIMEKGGPVLTLALIIGLIVSVWWLSGWLHTCVTHNRELTERLLTQQKELYAELRVQLAHCPPPR